MIARARSKYVESRSRTASGSRASAIGVNPTMSANSSDAVRLSDTGSDGKRSLWTACAGSEAPLSRPGIGVPHSLQNRPPPSGAPHAAHACDIGRPHSLQNFAPTRFAAPHRVQAVSDPAPGTSASFELRRETSGRSQVRDRDTQRVRPRTPKTASRITHHLRRRYATLPRRKVHASTWQGLRDGEESSVASSTGRGRYRDALRQRDFRLMVLSLIHISE